ncbi:YciI family protein [Rhodanobacter ginsengiterrae]|uniref:YciI family protein n=1 Tax=Rhodanobacter ginsengiterrae TaxID=2008451 RepID=UPI003CEB3F61
MNRYLILLMRRPELDLAVVPRHLAYLDGLREQGHVELSGGFSDQSGGAYLLRANDLAEATTLAHDDPAHRSGGWDVTVHEWLAH